MYRFTGSAVGVDFCVQIRYRESCKGENSLWKCLNSSHFHYNYCNSFLYCREVEAAMRAIRESAEKDIAQDQLNCYGIGEHCLSYVLNQDIFSFCLSFFAKTFLVC